MKTIDTLAEDIYHVLDSDQDHETDEDNIAAASAALGDSFVRATSKRTGKREFGKLWASDIGKPCLRQHNYRFNEPEKGEKLSGHTKFKFLYGELLEESVLCLAREAGHTINSEQVRVETPIDGWTVSGRIDAIIDNTLIDVKSTSSYGYKKYKEGIDSSNDSFGYREQLGFYSHYGFPDLTDTGFVFIDKQNGHICYTQCDVPSRDELESKIRNIITAVEGPEDDAPRAFAPEPFGKSGNLKLPIGCSYCDFRKHCYRGSNGGRGLRTFIYSHGPVYLTHVTQEPRVPEVTDDELQSK